MNKVATHLHRSDNAELPSDQGHGVHQAQLILNALGPYVRTDGMAFALIDRRDTPPQAQVALLSAALREAKNSPFKAMTQDLAEGAEAILRDKIAKKAENAASDLAKRLDEFNGRIDTIEADVTNRITRFKSIDAVWGRWQQDAYDSSFSATALFLLFVVVVVVGGFTLIEYGWPELNKIPIEANAPISEHLRRLYILLEIASVSAIVVWVARLILRTSQQRRHLATENFRRVAAAKAYLGLLTAHEVKLGDKENEIVFGAMFGEGKSVAIDDAAPVADIAKLAETIVRIAKPDKPGK